MKKFKKIHPYGKDGKTNFPLRGKTGVYIIYEGSEVVYIGFSQSDLYRTMYRHFQRWNHTGQEVVTYADQNLNDYTVRVIYCTPKQAESLEKKLIKKYKPRDNAQKYEDIKLTAYDNNTYDQYNDLYAESPEWKARRIKQQEQTRLEEEMEAAPMEEALFGTKKTVPGSLDITSANLDYIASHQHPDINKTFYYISFKMKNTGNRITAELTHQDYEGKDIQDLINMASKRISGHTTFYEFK